MLNSLKIKRYRNLKELQIDSLGRVNLITGKNNTGKSTLLEAVAIHAAKGNLGLMYQLLVEHGEMSDLNSDNIDSTETNCKVLSSLFNERRIGFNSVDAIEINASVNRSSVNMEADKNTLLNDAVSLRFVKYVIEKQKDEQGNEFSKRKTIDVNSETIDDFKIGFEIKSENDAIVVSLAGDALRRRFSFANINRVNNDVSCSFVRSRNVSKNNNGDLFDKIVMSSREQYVIEALKIIEPFVEKIAFVGNNRTERSAIINLSGPQQRLPLQSMGDGINRILTIILALVNADNGYLLIDEFENGLHYGVQEKLWEIIFKLSKELNVQVFVTTHSNDCIKGFEAVLNRQENLSDGKYIRLENENGIIGQVEYSANELKIANNKHIETR